MARYEIVAVSRAPQQLVAPVLVELEPLKGSFSLTDVLNEPSEFTVSVSIETLTSAIKTRLLDIATNPIELWLYRDSVRIFRGGVVGGDVSGDIVNLTARDGLFYTHYMLVETDKTFAAVDIYTIGAELVDDWQDQDYGNFGLNTVSIGTSGTTRSLFVAGATESPTVYETLMGFADGSFDVWDNPVDGKLNFGTKGTDLSATVFFERGVQSANIQFSCAPGVIASEVYATGTGADVDPAILDLKTNATLRAAFGRAGVGVTLDPVKDTSHLSDLNQKQLDDRGAMYYKPAPGMLPVTGATWGDFEVGDTISYTHDSGIGLVSGTYRVDKATLAVGDSGQEMISVEFE